MLRSVLGKSLWDQRRSLLAWTIAITAVGVTYAAFYPVINSPGLKGMMDSFPKGLLDALGYADIFSAAGYVGSTTFGLLGPILVIVFAAAMGAAAIAGDEESGRLDLLLAHPVSRWSVLLQRFAAAVIAMLLACAALAVGLVAVSGPAQLGEIGPANLVAACVHLAAFGTLFVASAIAVGAATGRRAVVFGVVAVVGVAGFFANNLAVSVDWLAWARDISPFHYYSGGSPLRNGLQPGDLGVLAASAIVLVGLGGIAFDRRDVAV